jgi:hypothetical protein
VPKQLAIAFAVEFFMILLSTILLTQPRSMFREPSPRVALAITSSGLVLLSLTFCWSIIFGVVLAMNGLELRF